MFAWPFVEKCNAGTNDDTNPCYDWSSLDQIVAQAKDHNVPVEIGLSWTPGWAVNPQYHNATYCPTPWGPSRCIVPPDDIDNPGGSVYWKTFVQALLAHYGPSSIYKDVKKYYETWNEPNAPGYWWLAQCKSANKKPCKLIDQANPSPGATVTDQGVSRLAILARILYMQSKTPGRTVNGKQIADPNAIVLTPSATGPDQGGTGKEIPLHTWLASYLQAVNSVSGNATYCMNASLGHTSPICADGVNFHGYLNGTGQRPWPEGQISETQGWGRGNLAGPASLQVSDVRAAVHTYDKTDSIPLYDTEGGWGHGDMNNRGNTCAGGSVTCNTAWLARYYVIRAGLYAPTSAGGQGLQVSSWYNWGDTDPANGWGTMKQSNGYPTATGVAYGWVTKWLTGNTVGVSAPAASPGPDFWTADVGFDRGTGYNAAAAKVVWYCGDHSTPPNCTWDPAVTGNWTVDTGKYDHYQDLTGAIRAIGKPLVVTMSPVVLFKGQYPPWCPSATTGGCRTD